MESEEWRVKNYLIDTRSISSVSAQSFESVWTPPPRRGGSSKGEETRVVSRERLVTWPHSYDICAKINKMLNVSITRLFTLH